MRSALCFLALFFAAGIWAASSSPAEGPPAFAASAACAVAAATFVAAAARRLPGCRSSHAALACAALLCAAAGWLRFAAWEQACARGAVALLELELPYVEGMVAEEPAPVSGGLRFRVELSRAGESRASSSPSRGTVLVRVRAGGDGDAPAVRFGQVIAACGRARRPQGRSNPGGFDYASYLRSQGIHVELSVDAGALVVLGPGRPNPLLSLALAAKARMEAAADAALPPREASLLKGIVLGSREAMPREIEEDFRHAGVYHILSVSGLHVQFVLSSLMALLSTLRVPKRWCVATALLALPFYALLTGLKPPVLRAVIMAAPRAVGPFFQRRPDTAASLALAADVILGIWPGSVLDPGFQLSFGATAGLVVLSPRVQAALGFLPGWLASSLSVTVSAQLMVFPVVARQFQEVSLVSLAVNPVVVPLSGWATGIGSAGMIAGAVWSPLGLIVNAPNRLILPAATAAAAVGSRLPGAFRYICPPHAAATVAYYATGALLWRAFPPESLTTPRGRWRFVRACLAAVVAVCLVHRVETAPPRGLEVVFLDVGQGDAIVVRSPGGGVTLVDAGGPGGDGAPCAGERVVSPALRWLGIRRLTTAVITHFHDDHHGGMAAVLRHTGRPRVVVRAGGKSEAVRLGIPGEDVTEASAGYAWTDGGVVFEVLHPAHGEAARPTWGPYDPMEGEGDDQSAAENNRSLVLHITYGSTRILLAADAGAAAERVLLDSGAPLRADLLKVGHHGSNGSSSAAFVEAVRPRYAVIPVGPNNHGLPGARAVSRLRAAGAVVLRTDRHGAVTVFSDGSSLRVTWTIASGGASAAQDAAPQESR